MSYSVHANVVCEDIEDASVLIGKINEVVYGTIFPKYISTGLTEVPEEVSDNPAFVDETWHDDKTMVKVYQTLTELDLSSLQVGDVVMSLQNAGILFRERVPE